MKNFSLVKLENTLKNYPTIKIQQEIQDSPRAVKEFQFCRSQPKSRKQPQLYALSKKAMELIGIDYQLTKNDTNTPLFLSGSKLIEQSKPVAHNYCGYQFGVWAGQLGDGRAHLLGSIQNGKQSYELQLKGSGITPFSRFADGNSVVSSAVRQVLASELMAGLKIPTTRAGSLVIADEDVKRDPFYNGRIKIQKAAIVLRISQTFLRFGSLEVCLPKGNMFKENVLQNRRLLEPLCDYAIAQHFPDIQIYQVDPYEELYKRLVKASAELVAMWQSIGYVHGVLNTDNMSLGGITIDYGPFAFMDYFSKDFVSNATDQHERYSFRRQPYIVEWNLQRLAEAMDPLFPTYLGIEYLKQNYFTFYNSKYYQIMSDKLGLNNCKQSQKLVDQLIENMHICGTHYTNFFRIIEEHSSNPKTDKELIGLIVNQSQPAEFYLSTLKAYNQFIKADISQILQHDPGFNPYLITQQPQRRKRKQSLTRLHCKERYQFESQLWEGWIKQYLTLRQKSKEKIITNPKYVILNFIAKEIQNEINNMSPQQSIAHFEKILEVLSNPYQKNEWFEQMYWKKAPVPVKLTCSS